MANGETQALLLETRAYTVVNNIRRAVLDVAANFQATNGQVQEQSRKIVPAGTWSIQGLSPNSGLVLRTSSPVTVQFTINGTPSNTVWSMTVNSLCVLSTQIDGLLITNPGLVDANVRLIQV